MLWSSGNIFYIQKCAGNITGKEEMQGTYGISKHLTVLSQAFDVIQNDLYLLGTTLHSQQTSQWLNKYTTEPDGVPPDVITSVSWKSLINETRKVDKPLLALYVWENNVEMEDSAQYAVVAIFYLELRMWTKNKYIAR